MISVTPKLERFLGWYSKEQLRGRELLIINPTLYDSYEQVGKKCRMEGDHYSSLYDYGDGIGDRYEHLCGRIGKDTLLELGTRVNVMFDSGCSWNLPRGCVMPKSDFDALPEDIREKATQKYPGEEDGFDMENPPEYANYTGIWELFDGEKVRM